MRKRFMPGAALLVVGQILSTTASASPTDQQITAYMSCMRAIVPVLEQHGRIDGLAERIGTASEAYKHNMPDRLAREVAELIILENGLAADGSDAVPDMGPMDRPSIWYPDVKPAGRR